MGYPMHQKGYWLYNPVENRFLVFRDVIFHEDSFPFLDNTTTSNTDPQQLSHFLEDDPSGPFFTMHHVTDMGLPATDS